MATPTLEDLRSVKYRVARDYASAARDLLGSSPTVEGRASIGRAQQLEEATADRQGDLAEAIEYLEATVELADWVLEDIDAVARARRLDPERLLRETVDIFSDVIGLLEPEAKASPFSRPSHSEVRPASR